MRVGTFAVAKAVSVLMCPHPPYPQAGGHPFAEEECRGCPSLEDKEEKVPVMHKGWVRVFPEDGPSSSGFSPWHYWSAGCSALHTRLDDQQAVGCAGLGLQPPLSLLRWQETSPAVSVPRLGGACTGISEWLGDVNITVSHNGQRQEAALPLPAGLFGAKPGPASMWKSNCVPLAGRSQVLGDLSSALH